MAKMTPRQKDIIKDIELKLNIPYNLKDNRDKASMFIRNHIHRLRKSNQQTSFVPPPTGNQVRFIKVIEKELNVEFDGTTFNEAWKFINKYKMHYEMALSDIYE